MCLDEKQAKKILDFLARKIKYDCVEFHYDNYVDNFADHWTPYCCVVHNTPTLYVHPNIFDAIWSNMQTFNMHEKSYAMLLEKMLDTSKNGIEVKCGPSIFLPSYSVLEDILIEMDLSCT